ncbi:IS3 family transposase [Desnuesiella massiliensis]
MCSSLKKGEVSLKIYEYIDFYNIRRLHKSVKGPTTMEYRNQTLVA